MGLANREALPRLPVFYFHLFLVPYFFPFFLFFSVFQFNKILTLNHVNRRYLFHQA